MPKEFNPDSSYTQEQAQIDLLGALLAPDDATYPWDTTAPESEAYFAEREQDFLLDDWSEEETATGQKFLTKLEQIWSNTSEDRAASPVMLAFAACLPESWLETITRRAQFVAATNSSMADKLVHCVQELLPSWEKADLLVLAQPFASQIQGRDTFIIRTLDYVCTQNWSSLSEIEQAKAILAIAHYAVLHNC